jgi:hypothetical protein
VADTHETDTSGPCRSAGARADQADSFQAPSNSSADPLESTLADDHDPPSHVYAFPSVSTVTHQVADEQDTDVSSSRRLAAPTLAAPTLAAPTLAAPTLAAPTLADADHDVPLNVSASLLVADRYVKNWRMSSSKPASGSVRPISANQFRSSTA